MIKIRFDTKLALWGMIPAFVIAVTAAILTYFLLRQYTSEAYNDSIGTALATSKLQSENLIENEKRSFSERMRQLSQNPVLNSFLAKLLGNRITTDEYRGILEDRMFTDRPFDGCALYDESGRLLFKREIHGNQAFAFSAALSESERTAKAEISYDVGLRLVIYRNQLVLPNLQKGYCIGKHLIDRSIAENFEQIDAASMVYQNLILNWNDTSQSILYYSTIGLLLLFGALAGTWAWFVYVSFRPFRQLTSEVERLAKGEVDVPIHVHQRDDEIGQLAELINIIMDRVRVEQRRTLELEKAATWREIAQRLAHEIKNPLTPIQLTVQQIRDSYDGVDDRYKRLLDECTGIIGEEIKTLRDLTTEFSNFARLPNIVLKPTMLNKLIEEVTGFYATITFQKSLDPAIAAIPLDAEAIRRALINLIDNALASLDGKQDRLIIISTQDQADSVTLTLADNGHGIPKSNLDRIFEPHFSTKTASMGLGLAIVKNILEEHRAEISVDSIENLGTTFTIKFIKQIDLLSND